MIAADCTAYAYANFHADFMRNKITLIGCPKLDSGDYTEKLAAILRSHAVKSVDVIRTLFCECKWINALVDSDVLSALLEKTKLFSYKKVWLWLFAKTGFTKRLIAEAKKHGNVRLIKYEEMIG